MTNEPIVRDTAEHLSDSALADLVLGLGEAATRERALAHAAACAACEVALREHADAADRARLRLAEGLPGANVVRPTVSFWLRPQAWIAAAAVLAVVLIGPALLNRGHATREPFPWLTTGEGALRRDAASDPHLQAGLEAYARHDLVAARRELEAAHARGIPDAARRLYLGSTLVAQGESERAIPMLVDVLNGIDVPEPWRTEGWHTLARAYRDAGRIAQADSLEHALRAAESPSRP